MYVCVFKSQVCNFKQEVEAKRQLYENVHQFFLTSDKVGTEMIMNGMKVKQRVWEGLKFWLVVYVCVCVLEVGVWEFAGYKITVFFFFFCFFLFFKFKNLLKVYFCNWNPDMLKSVKEENKLGVYVRKI